MNRSPLEPSKLSLSDLSGTFWTRAGDEGRFEVRGTQVFPRIKIFCRKEGETDVFVIKGPVWFRGRETETILFDGYE